MSMQSGEQYPFERVSGAPGVHREPTYHLYASNCTHMHKPYEFTETNAQQVDAGSRRALLQFMIAAIPNDQVLQD